MQLIEEDLSAPLPKSGGSYKSKPLSADDIKKAKSASASASPLSPPSSAGRRDSDPGKRQRDEEEAPADALEVSEEGPTPKKKKKRVSWASDENLVQVKTFERYLPAIVLDSRTQQLTMSRMGEVVLTHRLCTLTFRWGMSHGQPVPLWR